MMQGSKIWQPRAEGATLSKSYPDSDVWAVCRETRDHISYHASTSKPIRGFFGRKDHRQVALSGVTVHDHVADANGLWTRTDPLC